MRMYDFGYCMKQQCNRCTRQRECDDNEHPRKYKQTTDTNKTKRKKRKVRK